jgi:hypothetical protein
MSGGVSREISKNQSKLKWETNENRENMEAGEAERDSYRRSREHVAQEVHTEDDARGRDQKSHGQKGRQQVRIEESQ